MVPFERLFAFHSDDGHIFSRFDTNAETGQKYICLLMMQKYVDILHVQTIIG